VSFFRVSALNERSGPRYRVDAGFFRPTSSLRRRRYGTPDLEPSRGVIEGTTILICDDEPTLRELVRASLNGGYRFAEASDGYTAVALARDLSPDAIVLDLMLPRLSGLEVLEELRQDDELREIPVLVMTAWNDTEDAARAAGATSFVTKPFQPDDLKLAVEKMLADR
jgi:two-component system, chemotaxis family, chemotaxis protein CheY